MVPQSKGLDWGELFSRSNISLYAIIFFLALLSRILFLSTAQQIPVVWDARIYASAGIGLLAYASSDNAEPFARDSDDGGEAFKKCYLNHLDGEDIEWLYYKPPTLAESQKYLFYSGPLYPAIMAAIFALEWDNDFQTVRYFNALIDSLAVAMISMLAFILWRKRSAVVVTALIQLFYWPLVLTCGLLTLETITSFLISLLLLLLSLYYFKRGRLLIFAAGLIAGLLFLTKPIVALLSAPVGLFLLIAFRADRKLIIHSILLFAVGLAIFAVPWTVFTSDYYDRLAIRDPEYASANFRSSSAIEYEGYDLDYTDSDFWTYPLFDRITADPIGYGQLLTKKLIRLWWTPHDEFWQGPKWIEITFHRLLILIGLFGMIAIIAQKKWLLLLSLLIVLYYTGIHTIFHSVPRYNFNALPGLFLLATNGIVYASMRRPSFSNEMVKLFILGGLILFLTFINLSITEQWLLNLLPATIWMAVTIGLLVLSGCVFTKFIFKPDSLGGSGRMVRILFWIPIVILILTSMVGWSRDSLSEWSISIDRPETVLVTEVKLPEDFALAEDDRVRLAIDMTSVVGRTTLVNVDISGLLFSFEDATAPIDQSFYFKASYGAMERIMNLDKASLRWYRIFDLDPNVLAEVLKNQSTLKISIANGAEISQSGICLYGDTHTENRVEVRVPSFEHKSIERFKEFGDRRVYETYLFSSVGSRSYKIGVDGKAVPLPGRLRIFLIVYGSDFSRSYY